MDRLWFFFVGATIWAECGYNKTVSRNDAEYF